jgi:hypothetical protein
MGNLIQTLNSLIPFADPTRPLWRDAIYSIFLCTFLYFAPHIPFSQLWNKTQPVLVAEPTAPLHGELPPRPTVEDDSDSDESLNDEDLTNLIRQAEARDAALAEGFAGPANPQQANGPQQLQPAPGQPRRLRDPNREVGAKKAKSLARRERLRAYNEFLREQGDMQRAQAASVAQETEAELAERRARRAKVEAEIEWRAKEKREKKKAKEEKREKEESDAIQKASTMVADGLRDEGRIEIEKVAQAVDRDVPWVEKLLRKDGMLGLKTLTDGKSLTMLTSKGWVVRVTETELHQLYTQAASYNSATSGKVTWTEMGVLLDDILRKQPRVH